MNTKIVPAAAIPTVLHEQLNEQASIRDKVRAGRITWFWPLVMCFIRFPLLLICFLCALFYFQKTGHANASGLAQGITRSALPIVVDLACLGMLIWLTHKEDMRLHDLLCLSRKRILRDLLVGVGLFLATYIVIAALYILSIYVVYGPALFQSTQLLQSLQSSAGINPLGLPWHIIISLLILPISVGIVEEMVYRGYVQPRLQALSKHKWIAILIMAAGFGLQHVAFSLTSWQLALSGFLTTFVSGIVFGVIYLFVRQRLFALIFIHWQTDLISLGIVPLLMLLFFK